MKTLPSPFSERLQLGISNTGFYLDVWSRQPDMKSRRPTSPKPLTVLVFGMLMGAFTVGLWVWLLEPGGYRQRYRDDDSVKVERADSAEVASTHSLENLSAIPRRRQLISPFDAFEEGSERPALISKPASKPTMPLTKSKSTPSIYDSLGAGWTGRRQQVEAWAILPQAAKHLPPPDLMTEFWSRAVITLYGGVVLLGSGNFAIWDFETPGKSQRLLTPAGIVKLASTPGEALALDTQHRVWEISIQRQPALLPIQDGCGDLFDSAREGEGLASLHSGELMILNLRNPKRHRLIAAPPEAGAVKAVLTADGSVWVTSKGLWKLAPKTASWERISDAEGSLSAMGDGVLLLEDGKLRSEGNAEQAPDQPQVRGVRSVPGIGASLHADMQITVWGSALKGETKHLKTFLDADQIALGPTGLLVAW